MRLDNIESAPDAVRASITSLPNVTIDSCSTGGSNGYVFFGDHSIFRSRVAVKYYYYGENTHEEVSLIKHISNPHVLKVWDACAIDDGWAFFITDEQSNGNIDDVLNTGPIDTSYAIRIIRGVMSGVSSLHSAPNYILHRDLKPANILVDKHFSPIIADFGSIKRMPKDASEVVASQHCALYRPPESYDNGKYCYASDIYQIGLLFYQLLGGYLPYEPEKHMTNKQLEQYHLLDDYNKSKFVDNCLFDRAKKERLLDYSTLPAYTNRYLIQIIKKATKANHKDRYKNVAELQLALHRIGSLPNWHRESDMLLCQNSDNNYRIIKKNQYLIEREYRVNKWRKLQGSPLFPNEESAVQFLIDRF